MTPNERIQQERTNKQLTRAALSRLSGLSYETVYRCETKKDLSLETVILIAKALDCSVSYLVNGETAYSSNKKPRYVHSDPAMVMQERLRHLRRLQNISQDDVAELTGVQRASYSRYERGYIGRIYNISKLANGLGCTVSYLIGESDHPEEIGPKNAEITELYNALSEHNQLKVRIYAASLLDVPDDK